MLGLFAVRVAAGVFFLVGEDLISLGWEMEGEENIDVVEGEERGSVKDVRRFVDNVGDGIVRFRVRVRLCLN